MYRMDSVCFLREGWVERAISNYQGELLEEFWRNSI